MAVVFETDDDDKYEKWCIQHQEGFALNIRMGTSPRFITLHRADKDCVKGIVGKRQRKICGLNVEEINEKLREQNVRGEIKFCDNCKPTAL